MKKLRLFALITMLSISGCSSSADETESKVPSGIVKTEATKEYVYSIAEAKDGLDYLYYIDSLSGNESDIEDYRTEYFSDQTILVEGFDLHYPEGVSLPVEKIVLNFESEDATVLQKQLDERYDYVMAKNTASFSTTESPYIWNSLSLINAYEDDSIISFTTHSMEIHLKSEYYQVSANSYVFNKDTGKLMNDAEILAYLGISEDELVSQTRTTYASVFMSYDEVTAEVMYADDSNRFVPTGDSEEGVHYFTIQATQALSITGESSYGVILNTTSSYLEVGNPERTVGLNINRS